MTEDLRIDLSAFAKMFGIEIGEISAKLADRISSADFKYRIADTSELQEYILDTLKVIDRPYIARSKEENLSTFEKGWQENCDTLERDGVSEETIKPRYFRPSKFLRYNKGLIVSRNENLQFELFAVARDIVFQKYLATSENIIEIGCGSCQNLFSLASIFPDKKLAGMDWTKSSGKIAKLLSRHFGKEIGYRVFDMTEPESSVEIEPGSAIITVHAMEQIGNRHGPFLEWLISRRPAIVLNYEPLIELYDPENLLDFLAVAYSKKRNYLSGYLTKLRELARSGSIEIIDERRPYLGGVVHEASLVVWRPLG